MLLRHILTGDFIVFNFKLTHNLLLLLTLSVVLLIQCLLVFILVGGRTVQFRPRAHNVLPDIRLIPVATAKAPPRKGLVPPPPPIPIIDMPANITEHPAPRQAYDGEADDK
jgi:hypothetical protein